MIFQLLIFLVIGNASASGSISGHPGGAGGGFVFPETDYYYDSYAYNQSEQMSTIGASFDDYAAIDDFTWGVDGTVYLGGYTCWGVTTGSAPTSLELLVVGDASGTPDGAPISQDSYPVTCVNSGYTFGGYIIWVAVMDLSSNPEVATPVWLGSHRADGVSWYPLGGTTVTGSEGYRTLAAGWSWEPFSVSLEAGDLFKVIADYCWWPPAIARTTWAGVKSSF